MEFENISGFEGHSARIVIIGVGGGGNNTLSALHRKGIEGASLILVNTDAKHLNISEGEKKILIGQSLTRGLGAGGYPDVGKNAALESKNELRAVLDGTDLVFITCGLGGGTGTGAGPIIAKLAKDSGAIVISAVTLPFKLEGARIKKAEDGLRAFRKASDTVIVIENQRLLDMAGKKPLKEAFELADSLIATTIKGLIETISMPAMVNLDYADVKAVMNAGDVAAIGVGESTNAESNQRALEAATKALNNPLLDVDYQGAKGALIQVTGGEDMKLDDINAIGEAVQQNLDKQAMVKLGARILPEYKERIDVITIITGVNSPYLLGPVKGEEQDIGVEVIK